MKNINQVEATNITLETVLGLSQTINDLLSDSITLFTEYPSQDNGKKYRADRLGSKLLALSAASVQMTEKAQGQIETAVQSLMESGEEECK